MSFHHWRRQIGPYWVRLQTGADPGYARSCGWGIDRYPGCVYLRFGLGLIVVAWRIA